MVLRKGDSRWEEMKAQVLQTSSGRRRKSFAGGSPLCFAPQRGMDSEFPVGVQVKRLVGFAQSGQVFGLKPQRIFRFASKSQVAVTKSFEAERLEAQNGA